MTNGHFITIDTLIMKQTNYCLKYIIIIKHFLNVYVKIARKTYLKHKINVFNKKNRLKSSFY